MIMLDFIFVAWKMVKNRPRRFAQTGFACVREIFLLFVLLDFFLQK